MTTLGDWEISSDGDHVAPNEFFSPVPSILHPYPLIKHCHSASNDILDSATIEDILTLEQELGEKRLTPKLDQPIRNSSTARIQKADTAPPSKSTHLTLRGSVLLTPDFSQLICSDTPEPLSPGTQEVPFSAIYSESATEITGHNSLGVPLSTGAYRTSATTQGVSSGYNTPDQAVPSPSSSSPSPSPVDSGLMDSYPYTHNSLLDEFCTYNTPGNLIDDPDHLLQEVLSGEILEERVKHTCVILDLPMDPNTWSIEQVQRWIMYVLKTSDCMSIAEDAVRKITINGAMLTAMSKNELVMYFPPIVGETLYNELEVWYFGLTLMSQTPTAPMSTEAEYCNLESTVTSAPMKPELTPLTSYASTSDGMLPPLCRAFMQEAYVKLESPDYMQQDSQFFFGEEGEYQNLQSSITTNSEAESGYPNIAQFPPSCSLTSSGGHSAPGHTAPECEVAIHTRARSVRRPGKHTMLWQFLKDLLLQTDNEGSIRWLDRSQGIFKIMDSAHVAKLWGKRKNRPAMNYDKLSRSIRQYYKKGIIKKTGQSKRLVYQFCAEYNS